MGHKTRTTIDVDDEVLADFRAAVIRKHGKIYGHMYDEWNRALQNATRQLEHEVKVKRGEVRGVPIFDPESGKD